ncbi:hypothetical protein E2C01_003724 [Portunus trituberculatus]|uniref:Uncharacterized protein n=1 Tax=Portunus trituberculatus TaxID=210409 RepID=A0A5B7CQI3_PORTR|nr:hypothetical protein [Portunus trituberculatus]
MTQREKKCRKDNNKAEEEEEEEEEEVEEKKEAKEEEKIVKVELRGGKSLRITPQESPLVFSTRLFTNR